MWMANYQRIRIRNTGEGQVDRGSSDPIAPLPEGARGEHRLLPLGDDCYASYAPNTTRVPVEGVISFAGSSRWMAMMVFQPVQCMGMR